MNKLLSITILVFGMFTFLIVPTSVVKASGGIECTEPGPYGDIGVGPYGRICDTGIIFTEDITSDVVFAIGGVFTLGSALIVNGKLLKSKLIK